MSPERRQYAREYARRTRMRAWLVRASGGTDTCPAMLGNRIRCGWPLTSRLVAGATVPWCDQCERKRQGICIDCRKEPVVGAARKALRCGACKKVEHAAALDRYRARHPGRVKRVWLRRKARLTADEMERRRERGRLWKLARPSKIKEYKRKPWAGAAAYQAAYRERRREVRRELERERARQRAAGLTMGHRCTHCPVMLTGRQKKCDACRQRDYRAARAALTGAVA